MAYSAVGLLTCDECGVAQVVEHSEDRRFMPGNWRTVSVAVGQADPLVRTMCPDCMSAFHRVWHDGHRVGPRTGTIHPVSHAWGK